MKKSIFHMKLEALDRRLIKPSKQIKDELARCEAGWEGEKRVFYYLSELKEKYRIFHDIRLPFPNGYTFFQIDLLVLTPSALLILDAKHFQGHLIFDRHTRQLIRGEQTFDDPITQILRHKRGLEQWIDRPVPVLSAVVLTHSNARIEIVPENSPDYAYLIHAPELPARFDDFLANQDSILSQQDINQLSIKLRASHQPYDPDILKLYHIHSGQLHKGIKCSQCKKFLVKRNQRKWICTGCQSETKQAHLPALKDYVRLFGPHVTNKQLRNFTAIDSESIAQKLLKKHHVSFKGSTKNRMYMLPEKWKHQ